MLSIDSAFATFWPPSGLYLAALFLAGRRRDLTTVAVAVAANFTSDALAHGRSWEATLGFCLANTAEALTAVALLRRFGVATTTAPLRFAAVLACAAGLVAPAVGATIGSAVVAVVYRQPFDTTWALWATTDALGMLLFAPPILIGTRSGNWAKLRGMPLRRAAEFCVSLGLLAAALFVVFGVVNRPLPLLVLPPLLWLALRFDVQGVPFSNLVVAVMGVAYAHQGRGPFADCASLEEQMVLSQTALSVISLSFLAMAGLVAERRQTSENLAESESRLRSLVRELETTRTELEEVNLKLRNLAQTDPLTQLLNRRGFFDEFDAELARSARHALPFSLLLLDVDNFKSFNDTFGHSAGDEVLKDVGVVLADNVRGTDVVGRYGGEEFIVLLPATDAPGAVGVAERLREAIERTPWLRRPITVSVGAATHDLTADNGLRLIEEADQGLYASKAGGRNCSTHFLETVKEELAAV
jgi:diguanylate cyclase (GGDEF)-like protein